MTFQSFRGTGHDELRLGGCLHTTDRLLGLLVKAPASRAEDPGFESRLRLDFFGVESYK